VAVIVPIKGAGDGLVGFLRGLRVQDYAHYRIIAAVESVDDPAHAVLEAEQERSGAPLEIVVAGLSSHGGQKVANLLAGLRRTDEGDELVAFIDADTQPTPLWLARLVAGHVDAGREAVTGYRWMVPSDERLGSCLVTAANASIATLPRQASVLNLCWGGSVLVPHATLARIDIEAWWDGAVSDDLQMTAALAAAGIRVHAPRQCLLLSPVSMSIPEVAAFGVRQYRLLRTHRPGLWAMAMTVLLLPPVALLANVPALAAGSVATWLGLAVILGLGETRTRLRQRIQAAIWGKAVAGDSRRRWAIDRWLRPIWWLLHAGCAAAAALSRTIRWAGVTYRIAAGRAVLAKRDR
jgi:hypothetical protein